MFVDCSESTFQSQFELLQVPLGGNDFVLSFQDGALVAIEYGNGPVNVFKSHVNVGFFLGVELSDPTHLLEGTGKRMRHVELKPDSQLDTSALLELVDASYRDVKTRLGDTV